MRADRHPNASKGRIARAFGLRRALVTFAALVAILTQTFLVQTHVDYGGGEIPLASLEHGGLAAAQPPAGAQHAQAFTPSDTTPCVICQTLATAGAAIFAAAVPLAAPPATRGANAPALSPWVSVHRGYSWQSRAPPIRL